jgi:transcriptional regulator
VLIRRHDAALDDAEWRAFLADHDFGQLVAAGRDRDVPIIVPTHFVFDGEDTIRLHLARPNPAWEAIAENDAVVMSVIDAYTYVPTQWNANPGAPIEYGIPTSYYAAVQAICRATVIDDPDALAAILRMQLAHFQPDGGHAAVEPGDTVYGRNLSAIRGLELAIVDVRAKFKFGGNKTAEHRLRIADQLARRDRPNDRAAREHLLRRHGRAATKSTPGAE